MVISASIGGEVVGYGAASGGCAVEDDVVWITPELKAYVLVAFISKRPVRNATVGRINHLLNMFLNPMQQLPLVQQADIKIPIPPNLLTGKETEGTNAVVKVHHHDIRLRFQDNFCPIIIVIRVLRIPTTWDIDPNREFRIPCGVRGGEDIDK
jgi:hypothetical protein